MFVDDNYECKPVQQKLGEDCETVYPGILYLDTAWLDPIVLAQNANNKLYGALLVSVNRSCLVFNRCGGKIGEVFRDV